MIGGPGLGFLENDQFLVIDGAWHLLGTGDPHRPRLHRMAGNPGDPESWLRWEPLGELQVPEEDWNTGDGAERANAAFFCDARHADGWAYLFYAGSTETARFEGRGHSSIGVARSRDLVVWEVP